MVRDGDTVRRTGISVRGVRRAGTRRPPGTLGRWRVTSGVEMMMNSTGAGGAQNRVDKQAG